MFYKDSISEIYKMTEQDNYESTHKQDVINLFKRYLYVILLTF